MYAYLYTVVRVYNRALGSVSRQSGCLVPPCPAPGVLMVLPGPAEGLELFPLRVPVLFIDTPKYRTNLLNSYIKTNQDSDKLNIHSRAIVQHLQTSK